MPITDSGRGGERADARSLAQGKRPRGWDLALGRGLGEDARMPRIVQVVGAVLLVLLGAGCRDLPRHLAPGQLVAFTGQLAAGAECPMIVAAHDRRFSLAGDLG